jgi:Tfp pilus assembly protein PilX
MAITPIGRARYSRGIALLVTVIFMSVMLAFAVSLAALAYKQSVLASTVSQSETAFFAADAALECALYADQRQGAYIYANYSDTNPPDPAAIAAYAATACDATLSGTPVATWTGGGGSSGRLTVSERLSFDGDTRCADITIYKYANPLPTGERAFLFSTGYNVACSALESAGARIVSRGLYAHY